MLAFMYYVYPSSNPEVVSPGGTSNEPNFIGFSDMSFSQRLENIRQKLQEIEGVLNRIASELEAIRATLDAIAEKLSELQIVLSNSHKAPLEKPAAPLHAREKRDSMRLVKWYDKYVNSLTELSQIANKESVQSLVLRSDFRKEPNQVDLEDFVNLKKLDIRGGNVKLNSNKNLEKVYVNGGKITMEGDFPNLKKLEVPDIREQNIDIRPDPDLTCATVLSQQYFRDLPNKSQVHKLILPVGLSGSVDLTDFYSLTILKVYSGNVTINGHNNLEGVFIKGGHITMSGLFPSLVDIFDISSQPGSSINIESAPQIERLFTGPKAQLASLNLNGPLKRLINVTCGGHIETGKLDLTQAPNLAMPPYNRIDFEGGLVAVPAFKIGPDCHFSEIIVPNKIFGELQNEFAQTGVYSKEYIERWDYPIINVHNNHKDKIKQAG